MRTAASMIAILCAPGFAQDSPSRFEAASVKRSAPGNPWGVRGGTQGGPGTSDPERVTWRSVTLQFVVASSYGIRADQLSAPGWFGSDQYDITAKVPPGATRGQLHEMFQNLLAERFHLQIHHETRSLPAYNLVLGKKPKPIPSTAASPTAALPTRASREELIAPAEQMKVIGTGTAEHDKLTGRRATISNLAASLAIPLGRRVIDKTGLTGEYDFDLEFSTNPSTAPADAAPCIVDALGQQLGLELEDAKIPLDVIVVDRAERTPEES